MIRIRAKSLEGMGQVRGDEDLRQDVTIKTKRLTDDESFGRRHQPRGTDLRAASVAVTSGRVS